MTELRAAPWPLSIRVVSLVTTLALGGASFAAWHVIPRGTRAPFAETFGTWIAFVPGIVLLGALLFVVRGYEIASDGLRIQRLLWPTYREWFGLVEAWHDPAAMKGSLRLWGNGGLFAVTGYYRNRGLGTYRAFVTDPRRAVVLRFSDRVVVVSPEDPRVFLQALALVRPEARIDSHRIGPPA